MLWYLIDRIVERPTEDSIVGVKCFTRSELFFQDHFHGHPVVPGVLQIEMIATTGGKAIKLNSPDVLPMLAKVSNAKFYRSIHPGDQCHIHVELVKVRKKYVEASGVVKVAGEKVCTADVMFTIQPAELADITWKDPVVAEWESRQQKM